MGKRITCLYLHRTAEKAKTALKLAVDAAAEKAALEITASAAEEKSAQADFADEKYTGISVEGGCAGCARQYRLNGQTQNDFADREVEADVEKIKNEVVGGPLDQLSGCNVM